MNRDNLQCEVTARELEAIVDGLIDSYRDYGGINHLEGPNLPSQDAIREITQGIEKLLFPGFVEAERVDRLNVRYAVGKRAAEILDRMSLELARSFRYEARAANGADPRALELDTQHDERARCVAIRLLENLPRIRAMLATDAAAALRGDPAARSLAEVLLSYPGMHALAIHRVAHFLYNEGVPLVPRMMAELVHSRTGIDIHPGARIGEAFFIDHGTGVVIGETTVIGNRVKLYQGVTLGALSVPAGEAGVARNVKRHPTIEDDVTIYAGATILGGDTVIGAGSIIGGNVWLTRSVPAGTKVLFQAPRLVYKHAELGIELSPGHGLAIED